MKAVISLSGGLDSAVALGVISGGIGGIHPDEILAVSFLYGSKHNRWEVMAANQIAEYYKVKHRVIDLVNVFSGFKSSLLNKEDKIPEGHYEEESMRSTVVPGRNMIFASILAGIAQSEGAEKIVLGVHAGDHHIYFDCRPRFIEYLDTTIRLSTDGDVKVEAPFLYEDKKYIVRLGLTLKVPFHLTRTCYTHDKIACGRCGSCQERLLSFKLNNVEDPIEYVSREIMPKKED